MGHQDSRRGALHGPAASRGRFLVVLGGRGVRWIGRAAAIVTLVAVTSTATILGAASTPAFAVDYPTWNDVQAARNNESAKAAEIQRIQDLLVQLEQQVEETQALAVLRGEEYQAAQLAFDEAAYKAEQLQLQADAAQVTADESKLRAGQLAARLAKTGGSDLSASLFFDSDAAEDLLSQLGMASKISDQSAGIYTKATEDQNTAQSLTDQANVAKDALEELAAAAQTALDAAIAAADAAAAALAEQQANQAILQAQLSVLVENREATERDYQAGVAWRAEQARIAAEEAARAAAAAAAAGHSPASVSQSGWVKPAYGPITSNYGPRIAPTRGASTFHAGADIGAGCGYPIFAAHAGVVSMAQPNGGYGNYVKIENGDGYSTAYGHIVNGGTLVSRGQYVDAGQQIARVGTTGTSNGCHLHYEVRVNGVTIDPIAFMRQQGAPIG